MALAQVLKNHNTYQKTKKTNRFWDRFAFGVVSVLEWYCTQKEWRL